MTQIALKENRNELSGIEGKTVNSTYFNSKAGEYRNIEDHWFHVYGATAPKVARATSKKAKGR